MRGFTWDAWGMQLGIGAGPVAGRDAALLDEVCAHLAGPGVSPDVGVSPGVVAALAGRDGLRVPATITSFDPYGGPRARSRYARDAAATGLGGYGRGWRLAAGGWRGTRAPAAGGRLREADCGRPTAGGRLRERRAAGVNAHFGYSGFDCFSW